MGKFLAGIVVGLIGFEIAMIYGYGKTNDIPNHLPDDKTPLDVSCCQKPDYNGTKLNGVINKRKTAIV